MTRVTKASRLSDKAEKFLKLLAEGVPERTAAMRCWSGSYGRSGRWKNNTELVAAVRAVKIALQADSAITRQQCIDGFMQAINHASLQADASAQIKGWIELAKMHGFYEPEKTIHEHVHRLEVDYTTKSTAELLALAGEGPLTLETADWEVVDAEVCVVNG